MKVAPYVTILLLLIIIFWQYKCNHSKSAVIIAPNIDSFKHSNDSLIQKIKSDSIDYAKAAASDDSDRQAWLETKEFIEKKLSGKIASLTISLNQYKQAALAKDTVEQLSACAAIADAYDSLYGQALLYKSAIDSLQNNSTGRRELDSIRIISLQQSVDGLQKQIEYMIAQVQTLVYANTSLQAQLSKSKKGRKLLFGLGVGLGVIGGGFIGHELK